MTESLVRFSSRSRWLWAWLCMTCVPFLPMYWPLLLKLLSDTPDAYLCLVPVFAFSLAVRAIRNVPREYQNDSELNVILGSLLGGIIFVFFIWGPSHFSLTFYGEDLSVAFWPFWALVTTWLVFGVGITRYVWKPFAFLCFAIPPVYDAISNAISNALGSVTDFIVGLASAGFSWIRWQGNSGFVLHHQQWDAIAITTPCTGADSVMAVLIVLAFLLFTWRGALHLKMIWIASGVLCAVLMNWVRVLILIVVLHVAGSGAFFDDVHATLGLILFLLISWLLMMLGRKLGLTGLQVVPSHGYAVPGRVSAVLAIMGSALLTGLITVAWVSNQTNTWMELSPRIDVGMGGYPGIKGYQVVRIGEYDDSSVLGSGAHSYATAYSNVAGDYYRVEAFSALSGWRLEEYAVNNCLTFHGDQLLSSQSLNLPDSLHGRLYRVEVPPLESGQKDVLYGVLTVVFTMPDSVDSGTVEYERIEISTPLNRAKGSISDIEQLKQFGATFIRNVLHQPVQQA